MEILLRCVMNWKNLDIYLFVDSILTIWLKLPEKVRIFHHFSKSQKRSYLNYVHPKDYFEFSSKFFSHFGTHSIWRQKPQKYFSVWFPSRFRSFRFKMWSWMPSFYGSNFSQIHFIPYLHLSLSRVEIVLHIQKPCLMYLVCILPILLNFFHFRFSFRREPYPRFFPTVASRTCSYIWLQVA